MPSSAKRTTSSSPSCVDSCAIWTSPCSCTAPKSSAKPTALPCRAATSASAPSTAPLIYRSLTAAREAYQSGCPASTLCTQVTAALESIPGARVDYVELVDAETLHELKDEHRTALLAVAAYFGDVRLIDNIELTRA